MASATAGRAALRKVQYGWESTPGTAVAATKIWRGAPGAIDDQRMIVEMQDSIGVFNGSDRTVVTGYLAQLPLPETAATFEQLPVLFATGLGGAKTGVADGSGSSGYKYLTDIPETAAPTMTGKFTTWETGDDVQAEELEYGHALEINLKGVGGELAMMSALIQGRNATATTFTSLSPITVEEIIASAGKLYLDAIGGTFGSTQVVEQLLAFDITFKQNWVVKRTLDGSLNWSFPHYTGHEITGSLTFEHDSTDIVGAGSEMVNYRASTPRKMRLEFLGAALGTAGSGTTFSGFKGLRIDLPIQWTKCQPLGEQDGNSIIVAEFRSRYNATAADAGSVLIVNELAAL
jgi:hypothetical protein